MNLLIISWIYEYTLKDILDTLSELRIDFTVVKFDVTKYDKSYCKELYDFVIKSINQTPCDAVFSVNYFPDIAKACNDKNITYISWSYDCPLDVRDVHNTIELPTNRAFFFDKEQFLSYVNDNNTVFHMPLAVNSTRLAKVNYNSSFASDISFVGSIYHSSYPTIKKYLDDYYIGYSDSLIQIQKKIYGNFLIKDVLNEEMIEKINYNLSKHNSPFTQNGKKITLQQFAISLVTESTFENRLLTLALLSKAFDLKWYAPLDSESLPQIKKCPPVKYDSEMPQVFKSSKINLHIGLQAIPSGISLRQLDIMACGGFLLSSYQPELFDYFVPEEDFDYYTSVQEAYDKCSFYLSHDSIRQSIAMSGYKKTIESFDYKSILSKILDISFQ